MRVHVNDVHTFPEAAPQQINDAFAAFEATLEHYQTLAEWVGDLDLAADLRKRELTFTGFVDLPEGETPHQYLVQTTATMGKLAATLIWEWGLPVGTSASRMTIRAADHSFSATCETTYQVPAR